MLTVTKGKRSEGRGGRRVVIALMAAVLAIFALAGIGTAVIGHGAARSGAPADGPTADNTARQNDPLVDGLAASHPQRIRIPAIGVDSRLVTLGLQSDGKTMELPATATEIGWYQGSPSPGEMGTSIMAGYIKDELQPGALSDLGNLKVGQALTVYRKDGSVLIFTVDKIKQYPHGHFPAAEVYAASDRPALRIVTVGGVMHPGDRPGNVVVYTHLTKVRGTNDTSNQS